MINRNTRGFTLIELMVALVVSGLLMASLVALSGAVQKSFGRSKDISELQTNLRFAMRILSEDLIRAGFMYRTDPQQEQSCSNVGTLPAALTIPPALAFNANPPQFAIAGNFQSSRDYRIQLTANNTAVIKCRDSSDYTPGSPGSCASYPGGLTRINSLILPFQDGSGFIDLFPPFQFFRLDVGGLFSYHQVTAGSGCNALSCTILFQPPLNWNVVKGTDRFINPYSVVSYQVVQDPLYQRLYPSGTADSFKFDLQRIWATSPNPVPVANFLLSGATGLQVQVINDTNQNAGVCKPPWPPTINPTGPYPTLVGVGAIDPVRARALIITLRGRTETEDPDFTSPTAVPIDYGVDLDGDTTNGLAHVRVEHRVVELRNLAFSLANTF